MKYTIKEIREIIRNVLLSEKKANLWDNIRAKRKRGEAPAKPGDKDYPDEKAWQAAQESDCDDADIIEEVEAIVYERKKKNPCWKGYERVPGTKEYEPGSCRKIEADEKKPLSEALLYRIDRNVGVDKNIHRPGSTEFFRLFREARNLYNIGYYIPKSSWEYELLENLDIGEFGIYRGKLVPIDYPIEHGNEEHLMEAEYKGKKVELNKPKRGGKGGKSYVYVNSGKKDKKGRIKVKKVSFGSSMPDAMGKGEKARKRRKSFGDRHNCSDKKDKTKAGYWACRATKFFGRDISGWW